MEAAVSPEQPPAMANLAADGVNLAAAAATVSILLTDPPKSDAIEHNIEPEQRSSEAAEQWSSEAAEERSSGAAKPWSREAVNNPLTTTTVNGLFFYLIYIVIRHNTTQYNRIYTCNERK